MITTTSLPTAPLAPSARPLRVGICGSGITVQHIEGYQQVNNVEVTAISGPDVARCQQVAARYGIPHVFADYHEMLALGLDAVSIGVPNAFHEPMVIDALAAGCHVLIEKPLAINPAAGERIAAATRASDRVVMVAFNRRYYANAIALKRQVEAGTLGAIYHARTGWTRRTGIPGFGGWFTTRDLSGGGPLIDIGVHMLDLALYMMDYPRPVAVSGATYAAFGPRRKGTMDYGTRPLDPTVGVFDVEDFATGFIRFADGATLTLEASWAGYQTLGDDIYLHLYGDAGGAQLAMPDYRSDNSLHLVTEVAGAIVDAVPVLPIDPPGAGFHREVGLFVDSIRTGAPPPATVEQGLTMLRIIDAFYRSAAAGKEIAV